MSNTGKLNITVRRSQLGQVRGLGSARGGVRHWWVQRLTAMALLPLTIWFVISVLGLLGAPQPAVAAFVAAPVNTVLLVALVAISLHHAEAGVQTVIEDYVHREGSRIASLLAVKALTLFLALVGIIAVLKLAFTAVH